MKRRPISTLKQRLADLPDDVAGLQALVRELSDELGSATLMIEMLKLQIARFKRLKFGSSSEKDKALLAQLELALDDFETAKAQSEAPPAPVAWVEGLPLEPKAKPARRPLPEHLPREDVEHAPTLVHTDAGTCGCPACGNQMRQMGEDVTEVLEYVPETWKVMRHVRPKFSCRVCDTIVQAPASGLLARRLRHGPALLAHVVLKDLAAKIC